MVLRGSSPPRLAEPAAYARRGEPRNLACVDLGELHLEFHLAVGRVRQKPRIIRSLDGSGSGV
jgi:hypothetical protein